MNEQRMYIGPSIPGIVKYGTVFIGDLPGELTKKAAEIGSINNLVIPIDDFNPRSREGSDSFRLLPHCLTENENPAACTVFSTAPPSVRCTVLLSGTVPAAGLVKTWASASPCASTAAPALPPLWLLCGASPAFFCPVGVFLYP